MTNPVDIPTSKPVLAELSDSGEHVRVTFGYNPQFVKAVKSVPGARFRGKDKPDGPSWRLACDLPTMRKLREAFGDKLALGPELTRWGKAEVEKEAKLTNLSDADDAQLDTFHLDNSKFELRPYQRADIKFMAETNVLNANQPGAGKTIETIGAIIEADMAWGQHLVLAPKTSLRTVWETQVKGAYEGAGLDEPVILTGDTPKERREALAEAVKLAEGGYAFWLVVNPAMCRMKRQKVEGTSGDNIQYEEVLTNQGFIEVQWDSITIDEFHLMGLSNPSTATAQGCYHVAEVTEPAKRFALSGTPMGGKPIKLWGALKFLNPEEFTSRWNWARHWLVINTNGYGSSIEGIMPGREHDFYEHLKPYLVRRTKREALPGLPPKQYIDVWCPMTPRQAEQYKAMATDAEWRMEGAAEEDRLSATNILAEYTRLKQFAGAFCEVSRTGREVNGIPQLKVKATQDSGKLDQLLQKLLEENVIGTSKDDDDELKNAIVFSQFNEMVYMVAEALEAKGVPVATITGKTKEWKRNAIQDAFQTRETQTVKVGHRTETVEPARVVIMNTAAGTAIQMSQADTVHMLDETWVPDNQEQAEDRAHRGDDLTMAKDEVRIYYYRTTGSIEEYIQKLVADKALNNKTILDLRRRMRKELAKAEAEATAAGAEA